MVFNPVFLKYSSSRKIKTIYNIVKWSWKSKSEFSPFCELCSLRSKQIQNFLWTWSILAKTILILITHNRSHASEQSPVSDDVKQRIIFLQSSPAAGSFPAHCYFTRLKPKRMIYSFPSRQIFFKSSERLLK